MTARAQRASSSATVERALTALAVAWVGVVALVQVADPLAADRVASSPDAVASGRVWTLLSSSLVIDGSPAGLQLLLVAALTAGVLAREGAVVWWLAALAGHVGSALLAYATIGVMVAIGSSSARAVTDMPDYGISCVLAALNGALLVSTFERVRERRAGRLDLALLVLTVLLVAFWFATLSWYGVEHVYATALGALATHWHRQVA